MVSEARKKQLQKDIAAAKANPNASDKGTGGGKVVDAALSATKKQTTKKRKPRLKKKRT